jgi:hypothetical protein
VGSVSGFLGNSQAATIVVRDAMSGPLNATCVMIPDSSPEDGAHPETHNTTTTSTHFAVRFMNLNSPDSVARLIAFPDRIPNT